MKKLFILSFASILLLTGCGATETLSCSYETTANNGTASTTYDIDYEGEEVKKVRITYNYDFDQNNTDNGADNARITDNTTNGNNGTDDMNGTEANNGNNGTDDLNGTDANTGNNNYTGTNETNDTNNGITGYTTDDTNDIDGVGTGTDGTTNDSQMDDDGIVDGVVGSAIDTIVGGVTGIILDSAGLRDRHANVQNTYGNTAGFSVQNTNDVNNNYKVTYVIDYDTISENDLATLNLSKNIDDMRSTYVNQGFTCK